MNDIYVMPFFGNWAVKQFGKDNPISTHNKKTEAIRIAEQLTKRLKSNYFVLDRNFWFEQQEEDEIM